MLTKHAWAKDPEGRETLDRCERCCYVVDAGEDPPEGPCDDRLASRNTILTYLKAAPEEVFVEMLMDNTFQAGLDHLDPSLPCWEHDEVLRRLIYRGLRHQIDESLMEWTISNTEEDWIGQLGAVALQLLENGRVDESRLPWERPL